MNKQMNESRFPQEKFSGFAAMLLSVIVTIEIMVGVAMVLDIDFFKADVVALVLCFVVLYCGVVVMLTDR